jgi:hypothetical protein
VSLAARPPGPTSQTGSVAARPPPTRRGELAGARSRWCVRVSLQVPWGTVRYAHARGAARPPRPPRGKGETLSLVSCCRWTMVMMMMMLRSRAKLMRRERRGGLPARSHDEQSKGVASTGDMCGAWCPRERREKKRRPGKPVSLPLPRFSARLDHDGRFPRVASRRQVSSSGASPPPPVLLPRACWRTLPLVCSASRYKSLGAVRDAHARGAAGRPTRVCWCRSLQPHGAPQV